MTEADMEFEKESRDREKFSLHDCRADRIEQKDRKLTFFFPGGIANSDLGNDWPNTGRAAVQFVLLEEDGICFYLFRDEDGKTVREQYSVKQLMQKLNSKEWELEFAYRYQ
ncbi:MAG: hypothetical protein J5744_07865 [Oscillospiraceae bacterium]|nr:hypothetical protein [Oscillospiraceae bacterium]